MKKEKLNAAQLEAAEDKKAAKSFNKMVEMAKQKDALVEVTYGQTKGTLDFSKYAGDYSLEEAKIVVANMKKDIAAVVSSSFRLTYFDKITDNIAHKPFDSAEDAEKEFEDMVKKMREKGGRVSCRNFIIEKLTGKKKALVKKLYIKNNGKK